METILTLVALVGATGLDALVSGGFPADQPGVVALVRRGDEVLLRRGYGLADREARQPLTPEHVLRIGSLTKQFTAAAVMILAEQGKLALSDEVGKYVPAYPRPGVTIERLLSHTSGVPSYTDQPDFVSRMKEDRSHEQILATFKDRPLEFAPGTKWKYSNSGYYLLGLVIEKVSGQSYPDFLKGQIFAPLGMQHTGYGDDPRLGSLAHGYDRQPNGQTRPAPLISMKQPFSAGGLRSSVDDLARWDAAIRDGKLLKATGWQRVFTPARLADGSDAPYGFGWFLRTRDGHRTQHHGGGIPGFASHIMRVPDEKILVVLLANTLPPGLDLEPLAARLAATAAGRPLPEQHAIALPAAQLDRYLGRYQLGPGFVLAVTREGDRAFAQATGQGRIEIFPSAPGEFFLKVTEASLSFHLDDKGRADSVVLHQNGKDVPAKRLP